MRGRCVRGAVGAVATVCVVGAGLAIASLATASADAQPVANVGDCSDLFRFAHNPVPVAKTADE